MPAFFRAVCMFALVMIAICVSTNTQQMKPHAKVMALRQPGTGVLPLLSGPPETVTMRSGYVALEPGRSVGRHSTEHHEEMLVVLEGKGEMLFHDGFRLKIEGGTALYCPPETEHDVVNTGTSNLRYVYVVAAAPSPASGSR
jgi:mannose-6-phosphate isomerase-like protein (cupin superfamily)